MSEELNERQQTLKTILESSMVRHNPKNVLQTMLDHVPIAVGEHLPSLTLEVRNGICTCDNPDCEAEEWYAALWIIDAANEREFLVCTFDTRQLPAAHLEMGDDGQLQASTDMRMPNEMILATLNMLAPDIVAEMRGMSCAIGASTN